MVVRVVDMANTLRIFASMGHPFHSPADVFLHLHIMDLPFAVGYSIWIATDLACAWMGGQLRQAFTRRLSAHA